VRTAKRLPVLTMACGSSQWLSAVLVPSRQAEDLCPGAGGSVKFSGSAGEALVRHEAVMFVPQEAR
jgi:hypothetical protein